MPASLTELFYETVKTRLEQILSDDSYSLHGTLRSVQLKTYHLAGEQAETNRLSEPTIIVSDLGSDESSAEQVDTWTRTIRGQAWYASDDGDLIATIRAYEDMLRALNPAEIPGFLEASYSRSYADPFTQESIPGVILTFEGIYRSSFADPTTE